MREEEGSQLDYIRMCSWSNMGEKRRRSSASSLPRHTDRQHFISDHRCCDDFLYFEYDDDRFETSRGAVSPLGAHRVGNSNEAVEGAGERREEQGDEEDSRR